MGIFQTVLATCVWITNENKKNVFFENWLLFIKMRVAITYTFIIILDDNRSIETNWNKNLV